MFSRIFFPLVLCLFIAGCASDDLQETGISRASAIRIAEQHCPQYPDRYSYVDRAEWEPEGEFWMVALTDRDGDHGKAYKISRAGHVIDTHSINRGPDEDYDNGYGHHFGPGYGPGYGAGWYYW